MDGILIYRPLTQLEIEFVLGEIRRGGQLFLDPSIDVQKELQQIEFKDILLPRGKKEKVSQELLSALLEFGDHEVLGKTCKEHLSLDHTSVWYYHKFRIFFDMRSRHYQVAEISEHAKKFDQLYVYCNSIERNGLDDNVRVMARASQKVKINMATIASYFYLLLIRAFRGWIQLRKLKPEHRHLIISDPKAESAYLSKHTLENEVDDLYLGYLMQSVDDTFLFLDDLAPPKFRSPASFEIKSRYKTNHKNRAQINSDYIMVRGLFSIAVLSKLIKAKKRLKKTHQLLEQNVTDVQHRQIVHQLKKLNNTSVYLAFKYFAMERFFKKHPFSTITAQDENNTSTKVILDAAKSNQVTTIGVQHGSISKWHIGYRFTKNDRAYNGFTDYILAWGEYWKSILVEYGNYHPDQVICTGQIRTDIIKQLNARPHRLTTEKEHAKIILFATQPQPDPSLRRRAAEDAFTAIGEMENALLLIKLHPRENDADFYREIAESMGVTNYRIDEGTDLYSIIATSDIVLTCYSTVGVESVYFDKPLIILDHLEQDYSGYFQEGVAFQATNAAELKTYISDILLEKISVNHAAYDEFKSKYGYKIDGQVVQRCLNFIKSIS